MRIIRTMEEYYNGDDLLQAESQVDVTDYLRSHPDIIFEFVEAFTNQVFETRFIDLVIAESMINQRLVGEGTLDISDYVAIISAETKSTLFTPIDGNSYGWDVAAIEEFYSLYSWLTFRHLAQTDDDEVLRIKVIPTPSPVPLEEGLYWRSSC